MSVDRLQPCCLFKDETDTSRTSVITTEPPPVISSDSKPILPATSRDISRTEATRTARVRFPSKIKDYVL